MADKKLRTEQIEDLVIANITDITASAAELNVLDGIPGTLTATELGYVDGVTSAIQTQLNAKLNTADIDDTPVNGETAAPISSNWAFDHEADTSTHGVSGALVGTTDTQTLTNKTLGATTMSGDLTMGDQDITGVGAVRFTQQLDNGSKTASFSIDFATDQHQKVTLTANTMTLTLDTTSIGVGVYTLEIVNGGLATLTWASETGSITWAGGAAPTLTSSGTDVISLLWTGSAWRGQASLAFA